VSTKSETGCTANDITRQVEKHVFGEDVRRVSDQSPFCRRSPFRRKREIEDCGAWGEEGRLLLEKRMLFLCGAV